MRNTRHSNSCCRIYYSENYFTVKWGYNSPLLWQSCLCAWQLTEISLVHMKTGVFIWTFEVITCFRVGSDFHIRTVIGNEIYFHSGRSTELHRTIPNKANYTKSILKIPLHIPSRVEKLYLSVFCYILIVIYLSRKESSWFFWVWRTRRPFALYAQYETNISILNSHLNISNIN